MSDFSNPNLPIDYGKDYNFFTKLVISTTDFNTNCDIIIPFTTSCVTFQLESGGPVSYSFNGIRIHGDMTASKSSKSLTFQNRAICKVWFKGTGTVRIEAW